MVKHQHSHPCRLVDYCVPVQGSLLVDARGSEEGVMVNASDGRLAQERAFYKTIPQCHSLLVPVTKSALKPTLYGLIHPSDPDALSPLWVFLEFNFGFEVLHKYLFRLSILSW